MSSEEIDVYQLLKNSTEELPKSETVHILSNLNLEEFINVSDNKTLMIDGEQTDTLQLSKSDGWIETQEVNADGYNVLSNVNDSQIEFLIKGIEVDIC